MSETNKMDKLILNGQNIDLSPDYQNIRNKPKINGVTVDGNKTLDDFGVATKQEVENVSKKVAELPTGMYYGSFDDEESLPDAENRPYKGYAYVYTGTTGIYYVYATDGEGAAFINSGNKFFSSNLDTNLANKSTDKAPNTKIVAEGIEESDLRRERTTALSAAQKYQVNANINNRVVVTETTTVDNIEVTKVKALGYKVLNPELTFAEQVANVVESDIVVTDNSNTIFEIRDEFDLEGESITIPANCTLKFNGGKLKNGIVSGVTLKAEGLNKSIIEEEVFSHGVNLDVQEKYVIASTVGFIEEDETAADYNSTVLDAVINSGKYLYLDSDIYVSGSHSISSNTTFKIDGTGTLRTKTTQFFVLNANSSLYLDNIHIIVGSARLIHYHSTTIQIDTVQMNNCNVSGERIMEVGFADVDYSVTPTGVKNFIITNCKFNIAKSAFIIGDTVYSNTFVFSKNHITNMVYTFLNVGVSNSYVNIQNFEKCCDYYIEDNIVSGAVIRQASSTYFCFALIEGKVLNYRRNKISNIIGCGTKTGSAYPVYDGYFSVRKLYYENNIITNVCELPEDGIALDTGSELVKSKGNGYSFDGDPCVRIIQNNIFQIDFEECRKLAKAALNIEWSDANFELINQVWFSAYVSTIDSVEVNNNIFTIKNGGLYFPIADNAWVKKAVITNNTFNVDKSNNGVLFPAWDSNGTKEKNFIFQNNIIYSKNKIFNVFCREGLDTTYNSKTILIVTSNITNSPLGIFTKNAKVFYADNKFDDFLTVNDLNSSNAGSNSVNIDLGKVFYTKTSDPYIRNCTNSNIESLRGIAKFTGYTLSLATNGYHGLTISFNNSIKATFIVNNVKRTFTFIFNSDGLQVFNDGLSLIPKDTGRSWTTLFMNNSFEVCVREYTTAYSVNFNTASDVTEVEFEFNKADLPTLTSYDNGVYTGYSTLPIWWDGTKKVNALGFSAKPTKGLLINVPFMSIEDAGFSYFATDEKYWLTWDGEAYIKDRDGLYPPIIQTNPKEITLRKYPPASKDITCYFNGTISDASIVGTAGWLTVSYNNHTVTCSLVTGGSAGYNNSDTERTANVLITAIIDINCFNSINMPSIPDSNLTTGMIVHLMSSMENTSYVINHYYQYNGTTWDDVTDGIEEEVTILVKQAADVLTIAPSIWNVTSEGGSQEFVATTQVSSLSSVTIIPSDVDWLTASTIYGGSSTGTGKKVTLTAVQNSGEERSASVTFKDTANKTATVIVTQAAASEE